MTNLLQVTKSSGLFSSIYKACTLLRTQSVLNAPVASYVSQAKIYESLDIPKPPKRTVGIFFRFATERLAGKKLSREQRLESIKSLGAEWRQKSEAERAQLYPEYNSDVAAYKTARAEWEKRLTEVQRAQIADAIKSKKETENQMKEKRQHNADCIELNKPKAPGGALVLFRRKSGNNGKIADVAEQWRKLSPSEQQHYRDDANELRVQYDKVLTKWEKEMIQQGRADLVRQKTIKAIEKAKKPQANK